MTKTIHPLLSQCSSKKWGRGGGADFKFRPIGGALIRVEGGGGLIRGFTVVKCQQSTQTYLNQFHNILGFVKANNIKVDLRECDWLGCGNCNEQV